MNPTASAPATGLRARTPADEGVARPVDEHRAEPGGPAEAGPDEPVFSFRDVTLRFDATDVLDRVTCRFGDGCVSVLTGPSGAGKTTLLRLCNRLDVPTTGTVLFRGRDLATLDPLALRRRVGMVFQRPTLFPGTLGDNFAVAAPAGGRAHEDALEAVGLPADWLDRPGDQLSGGEAQRACLARTLLTGPEVLLMDEPTASLDFAATRTLEELTTGLARTGMAVIWVSHDLSQVARIADTSVVLLEGRVATDGEATAYLAGSVRHEGPPGGEAP